MLNKLNNLVNELKQTSSSNEKKDILLKYSDDDVKSLLKYVYCDFVQFHVTSANLIKRQDLIEDNNLSIVELFDKLNNLDITGHKAISMVNGFISNNNEYKELIYNMIDKNLKVRIDAKLINNVFPKLIPTFEVALAYDYEEKKKHVDFNKQKWMSSRKMDGCRLVLINRGIEVELYSRQGKKFETLNKVAEEFKKLNLPVGVYDGEVCLVDNDGNEDFSSIMKEIRRKNHTIQNPKYKVFDYISISEFFNMYSPKTFIQRYEYLKATFSNIKSPHIDILSQTLIRDEKHFEELKAEAKIKNWEGLIIREDVPYEGKRSRHLLKVKAFFDAEFKVLGTYTTKKRMFFNGEEKEVECMGGVNIEYKGYSVDVGSGWSDEERLEFFAHPENIINKIITVQWFEETKNDKGTISLRFPTKKFIYEEGRNV